MIPLLHGPYGEDGTVQGLLDLADLPYVGSGVLGSAVGMHKGEMKQMFAAAGLPQGAYLEFRDGHDRDGVRHARRRRARAAVLREARQHGLVGRGEQGARRARSSRRRLDVALAYDEEILVEAMVDGREIEVAVLGSLEPEASLPGEVVPGAEFYSYADKYEDGTAQLLAPAPLSEEESFAVRTLAVRAFTACRCEGMARVDCFYEEGGRGFLVNEVNTIPGFTPISMYPKLWEVSGLRTRSCSTVSSTSRSSVTSGAPRAPAASARG